MLDFHLKIRNQIFLKYFFFFEKNSILCNFLFIKDNLFFYFIFFDKLYKFYKNNKIFFLKNYFFFKKLNLKNVKKNNYFFFKRRYNYFYRKLKFYSNNLVLKKNNEKTFFLKLKKYMFYPTNFLFYNMFFLSKNWFFLIGLLPSSLTIFDKNFFIIKKAKNLNLEFSMKYNKYNNKINDQNNNKKASFNYNYDFLKKKLFFDDFFFFYKNKINFFPYSNSNSNLNLIVIKKNLVKTFYRQVFFIFNNNNIFKLNNYTFKFLYSNFKFFSKFFKFFKNTIFKKKSFNHYNKKKLFKLKIFKLKKFNYLKLKFFNLKFTFNNFKSNKDIANANNFFFFIKKKKNNNNLYVLNKFFFFRKFKFLKIFKKKYKKFRIKKFFFLKNLNFSKKSKFLFFKSYFNKKKTYLFIKKKFLFFKHSILLNLNHLHPLFFTKNSSSFIYFNMFINKFYLNNNFFFFSKQKIFNTLNILENNLIFKTKTFLPLLSLTSGFLLKSNFFFLKNLKKNNIFIIKRNLYSFSNKNEMQNYIIKKYLRTRFEYSSQLKTTFFKRFNLSELLFGSSNNVFNYQNNNFLDKNLLNNQFEIPTFSFWLKSCKWSKLIKSVEPFTHDVLPRRIKFKPGYMNIWRSARQVLKDDLSLNFRYQYKLTRFIIKFYKLNKLHFFYYLELKLENVLLKTKLLPDYETINLFLENNLIYVNGSLCQNKNLSFFTGDFIQFVIHIKFYILFKWLKGWFLQKRLRLKKKIFNKLIFKSSEEDKQKTKVMPKWILKNKNLFFDIPQYLEVDFFTLSAIVLYEPFLWTDIDPYHFLNFKASVINLYNWKYIT